MTKTATLNRLENMLGVMTGKELVHSLSWEDQVFESDVIKAHPEINLKALYPLDAYTTAKKTPTLTTDQLRQRIIKLADHAEQTN